MFWPIKVPVPVAAQVEWLDRSRLAIAPELAENVKDLTLQRLSGGLELVQKLDVDVTFPRVLRDEVPEMADLGLSNSVDATESLFNSVRIPGQVIVHHQMSPL